MTIGTLVVAWTELEFRLDGTLLVTTVQSGWNISHSLYLSLCSASIAFLFFFNWLLSKHEMNMCTPRYERKHLVWTFVAPTIPTKFISSQIVRVKMDLSFAFTWRAVLAHISRGGIDVCLCEKEQHLSVYYHISLFQGLAHRLPRVCRRHWSTLVS